MKNVLPMENWRPSPLFGEIGTIYSQARYMLIEAKNAAESDSPVLALSGIYFAMFHAARAVLDGDGIREKSHFCVEKYLESYVSSGTLERNGLLFLAGCGRGGRRTSMILPLRQLLKRSEHC